MQNLNRNGHVLFWVKPQKIQTVRHTHSTSSKRGISLKLIQKCCPKLFALMLGLITPWIDRVGTVRALIASQLEKTKQMVIIRFCDQLFPRVSIVLGIHKSGEIMLNPLLEHQKLHQQQRYGGGSCTWGGGGGAGVPEITKMQIETAPWGTPSSDYVFVISRIVHVAVAPLYTFYCCNIVLHPLLYVRVILATNISSYDEIKPSYISLIF